MEFVLTVLGGGPDSSQVITKEKTVKVRKAIKEGLSKKIYSTSLKKIKIVLLVEGNITVYEEEAGAHNLVHSKKKQEISIDVLIKNEEWKSKQDSEKEISNLLTERIYLGYEKVLEYLSSESVDIEGADLLNDLKHSLSIA